MSSQGPRTLTSDSTDATLLAIQKTKSTPTGSGGSITQRAASIATKRAKRSRTHSRWTTGADAQDPHHQESPRTLQRRSSSHMFDADALSATVQLTGNGDDADARAREVLLNIRRRAVLVIKSRTVREAKERERALQAKELVISEYYGSSAVTVFLDAVGEGNIARVTSFLEDQEFCCNLPNAVDAEGRNALHLAALEGYQSDELPLVQTILDFAARSSCLEELLCARDKYRNTPLILCCKFKSGNVEKTTATIWQLLSRGARPWVRQRSTGMTPLHWLCHYGLAEAVEALLMHAAEYDMSFNTRHVWKMLCQKNAEGLCPVDIAGHKFRTSVEYDKLSPFPEFRVERKYADIVIDLLLVAFRQEASLPKRLTSSRYNVLTDLGGSEKRIDIDELVHARARRLSQEDIADHPEVDGDEDTIRASHCHFFAELVANPQFLQTALFHASFVGDVTSVRHCMRLRKVIQDTTGSCVPDPLHPDQTSANSRTPLHAAAEMGHREIIQEFVRLYERLAVEHIRAGRPDDETPFLDFNVPDEAGFTPLHLAVLMANIPRLSNRIDVGASVTTVIYLMSHGADPFAMNKYAFPPARYANDTVSGFLLTMVEALEDDDASYTASKATEADAMLDASLGGAFARTTSNVTKAIAATHRRESKLGGHARTGDEAFLASLAASTAQPPLLNGSVDRVMASRLLQKNRSQNARRLRARKSSMVAASIIKHRESVRTLRRVQTNGSALSSDVDAIEGSQDSGDTSDAGILSQLQTSIDSVSARRVPPSPLRRAQGNLARQKDRLNGGAKLPSLRHLPSVLPRVASRPQVKRLNSSAPEDILSNDTLSRRLKLLADLGTNITVAEAERSASTEAPSLPVSTRASITAKEPHIFDQLSRIRSQNQKGKIDFVLVFEHKFNHLADKVYEQLEATGLTVQQVTFPLLEPRKSFVLVSCHLNIIAKYAEELGFEKKLVLTVDRLPFRVRAKSMFEPFRSRDRQEVIFRIMTRTIKLQSYLTITSAHSGPCRFFGTCLTQEDHLMVGCFPMHNLQACSEIRHLMRERVNGLLYPLNRFWEYIIESPKNEFYIVNLLAGYMGEKAAIFYHFLSFYTVWLVWIAIPGFAVSCDLVSAFYAEYEVVANLNSALLRAIASNRGIVVIAFLTCIWSAVFTRMYERKEKEILSEWDMINFKQRELERTEYVGDEKISQKTGKLTRHYGVGRRRVRKMAFAPLILTSIFLIWICYWAIEIFKFTTELTLGEEYSLVLKLAGGFLNGGAIIGMNSVYTRLAVQLTKWENHQFVSEFDRALILKTFLFQFFNQYLAVFMSIFWFQRIDDAAILVIALMVLTQIFNIIVDHALPTTIMHCRRRALRRRIRERKSLQVAANKGFVSGMEKGEHDKSVYDLTAMQRIVVPRQASSASKVQILRDAVRKGRLASVSDQHLVEILLNELCTQGKDMHRVSQYMDIVLQFGYVVMFSACAPVAPVLAFMTNMWAFRGETTVATYVRRRQPGEGTGGIGIWVHLMEFLVVMGAFTTMGILYAASDALDLWSFFLALAYPSTSTNSSFVWGNLPMVLSENLTLFSLGEQANAVANAAQAHAIAAEAAEQFAFASHESLEIAAMLRIDSNITDLLPTLHDIWRLAYTQVSLDHYVALVHAHSSAGINSATALAETQMPPTHEWIPAEVTNASNSILWSASLHALADAINATVSSAVSEQVLAALEWNHSTYELMVIVVLQYIYIAIVVVIRMNLVNTPRWVRDAQAKKRYKTNLYSKAALNLDNHRETSGSHYKPQPLPTNAIRLRPELKSLVETVASNNHETWCRGQIKAGWKYAPKTDREKKEHNALVPYVHLSPNVRAVNFNVAEQNLKGIVACGFDIMERPMHASTRFEKWRGTPWEPGQPTFSPRPMQVEHIHLPVKFIGLVEMLAEHAHETWAETKMHAGWSYGKVRNDSMKKHPMLVPYK
eukprot:INCI5116.1.p1 GENE.INCI5116.1~~INCI5116.1.p1  ORF type:complete len:1950 (-),score=259.30 INCI5116.1:876-6725(-)